MQSTGDVTRVLAQRFGERLAVTDDVVDYTFGQFHRRSSSLASGLLHGGLRPGEVVAWIAPNCAEFLVAYFATGKAGLRFSPLNPRLTRPELHAALTLLQPATIIAAAECTALVDAAMPISPPTRRYVLGDGEPAIGWLPVEDLLIEPADPDTDFGGSGCSAHEVFFTSGTTGEVKGVEKRQNSRLAESQAALAVVEQAEPIHQLRITSQFHMGGVMGPYQTLLAGGAVTVRPFSADTVAQAVGAGVTFIAAVPAQFSIVLNSGALEAVDTTGVRYVSSGGSASSPAEYRRLQAAFPRAELVHIYGSTEAGLVAMVKGEDFMSRPTSIGTPVPGVEIRILDDSGSAVAPGHIGELWIRSPFMMSGYYRRPDLTAATLSADGYLSMGDAVRQDCDGYLYIAGRRKEMIITGGENVYPAEVEAVIGELDFITGVTVLAQPDPTYQERVTAVISITETARLQEPAALGRAVLQSVKASLASYKAPREIYLTDDFPTNAMGKVDKKILGSRLATLTRLH